MQQYKFLLMFGALALFSISAQSQEIPEGSPPPTCDTSGDPSELVSTAQACGAPNLEGKEKSIMDGCCSIKEECYGTCNSLKTNCDQDFQQCMVNACINSNPKATYFIKRRCTTGWSWDGPGMVGRRVAQAQDFGCAAFTEAQNDCQ
ncbi:hypothetical protein K7432_016890 [Basidiobolus ranarum]|uniref:Uncharacterized protein n=1 Tax=Basidiobolus ranarum TaxID=34480 RepID=A0ABR2WE40_9FUNG